MFSGKRDRNFPHANVRRYSISFHYMTHISYTKASISEPADFLGPTEAATYLRIGRKTVYHWIHQGYFPHHRMGKLIKIRRSDLDAFLAKTRVYDEAERARSMSSATLSIDQGRPL